MPDKDPFESLTRFFGKPEEIQPTIQAQAPAPTQGLPEMSTNLEDPASKPLFSPQPQAPQAQPMIGLPQLPQSVTDFAQSQGPIRSALSTPLGTPQPQPQHEPEKPGGVEGLEKLVNVTKAQNEKYQEKRGLMSGLAGDVVGGAFEYGTEMLPKALRAVAPKGGSLEQTAQDIEDWGAAQKVAHPFLAPTKPANTASEWLHGGVRSAAQSLAAGLPTAALATAAAPALGAAGIGAAGAGLLGYATGAASQFGLSQYQDVMDRAVPELMKKEGLTEEQAEAKARPAALREAGYETGFELMSDVLSGGILGFFGKKGAKGVVSTVKNMIAEEFTPKAIAKKVGKTFAVETGSEVATGGMQQMEEQKLGLSNEGFLQGAKAAFGPAGVASLIFAGLGLGGVHLANRSNIKALENGEADMKRRYAAVNQVFSQMQGIDPKVADFWRQNALQALINKSPISTDEDIMEAYHQAQVKSGQYPMLPPPQAQLPPGQGPLGGAYPSGPVIPQGPPPGLAMLPGGSTLEGPEETFTNRPAEPGMPSPGEGQQYDRFESVRKWRDQLSQRLDALDPESPNRARLASQVERLNGLLANAAMERTSVNDQENPAGIPSQIGFREESEPAQSEQGTSGETTQPSGVFQEPGQPGPAEPPDESDSPITLDEPSPVHPGPSGAAINEPTPGPKISGDLETALQEAASAVTDIQAQGPSTTKEIAEEKAHVKGVLHREIKAGTIPVGSAVRATEIDELHSILKDRKLVVGQSFEGTPGISATQILDAKNPVIPMYGDYERIPVAIIAPPEAISGKGQSANEVLLDHNTDVTKLRFSIDKHDKVYTIEELPDVLKEIAGEKAEEKAPEVAPVTPGGTAGIPDVPGPDKSPAIKKYQKDLTPFNIEFVHKKVYELGSIEAVDKKYHDKDKKAFVDQFASEYAREVYGKKKEEKAPELTPELTPEVNEKEEAPEIEGVGGGGGITIEDVEEKKPPKPPKPEKEEPKPEEKAPEPEKPKKKTLDELEEEIMSSTEGKPSYKKLLELKAKEEAIHAEIQDLGKQRQELEKKLQHYDERKKKIIDNFAKKHPGSKQLPSFPADITNGEADIHLEISALRKKVQDLVAQRNKLWRGHDVEQIDFRNYVAKGKDMPEERVALYDDHPYFEGLIFRTNIRQDERDVERELDEYIHEHLNEKVMDDIFLNALDKGWREGDEIGYYQGGMVFPIDDKAAYVKNIENEDGDIIRQELREVALGDIELIGEFKGDRERFEKAFRGEREEEEPWKLTKDDYDTYYDDDNHKQHVMEALADGKDVPAEVLADYPDLVKKEEPEEKIDLIEEVKDMSMEDIDALLDEAEEAKKKEAEKEQEAPKEPKPETVGGPRGPGGPNPEPRPGPKVEPKAPKAKSAADILSGAASHGVKGIDEAITGLYELFGGKALKAGIPFDEATYQKAKPHFLKAMEEFRAAGKGIKEFIKWAYDSFSSAIRPYLRRFIQEEMKGQQEEATSETTETAPEEPIVEGVGEGEEGGGITIDEIPGGTGGGKGKGGRKPKGERKPKEKGEKDTTPKMEDFGEKLGGKRASADMGERIDAIKLELDNAYQNATPEQLTKALIAKTARAEYFKINHAVEGRTPGTGRFLKNIRDALPTWAPKFADDHGIGGWGARDFDKIKNFIASEPGAQATAKKSAASYIALMEQLNEAVQNTVEVFDTRQAILSKLVGEEKANAWQDYAAMESDLGKSWWGIFSKENEFRTDFNKQLHSHMQKIGEFQDLLMRNYEKFIEHETDETKDLPMIRDKKKIFDIKTPDKYRKGKHVSEKKFMETFGFRGGDFGKWVEDKFRKRSVDLTYDSFKMLSEVLGAPDLGMSINDEKRLGIGWGARGRGGKTAAAFYLENWVIGLTKPHGDGSLSHEWAHALDRMSKKENMTFRGGPWGSENAINDLKRAFKTYYDVDSLEDKAMQILKGMWGEARSRTSRLLAAKKFLKEDAIDQIRKTTKFHMDAIGLDGGIEGKYFSKLEEEFARAFESYVASKIQGENDYLVDTAYVSPGYIESAFNRRHGAYPNEKERPRFIQLFDDFFSQMEWDENGVPKLKEDYTSISKLEEVRAWEVINDILARIDSIFEALYSGEQSADGLYWYAYEQTARGAGMQPKGFKAYDDKYDLKQELIDSGEEAAETTGMGAVAYTEKLKTEDSLMYFLRPIKYNESDTKIELENPDGTISDVRPRGLEALEEASTPHGGQTSGPRPVTGSGEAGVGEDGGIDIDADGEGVSNVGGEGDSASETDISPVGGRGTDAFTGPESPRVDFVIRPTTGLENTNQTERFNNNIAAIRVLKQIEAEGRRATPEEQNILVRYSGWGELSEALSPYPNAGWKGRAEMVRTILSEEEIRQLRTSSIDAYYTPPTIADQVYEGLQKMGFSGGRVLEPSCGIGHLFGTMPEKIRRVSSLTGVDIDGMSTRIAQQLYQTANFIHSALENTQIPENFYDLTISNVPFGTTQPFDAKHNKDQFLIHDYFINKMIDVTKPGGVIAAITSTGTMDKGAVQARETFAEKADLVGAMRLPNGIFPGAKAGADLLFFRKKGERLPTIPDLGDWVKSKEIDLNVVDPDGISQGYKAATSINSYFVDHPEDVLGELGRGYNRYGGSSVQVDKTSDFNKRLLDAVDRLPTSIFSTETVSTDVDIASLIPDASHLKDFNYYEGDDGKLYQNQNGAPIAIEVKPKELPVIRGFIKIRGIVRSLLKAQALDKPTKEIEKLRKDLKTAYNAFVKANGPANTKQNRKILNSDPDAPLIYALEKWDRATQTVIGLADIFTKNTVAKIKPPKSADNSTDALVHSLQWRGKVDIPYMAKLTGKTPGTIAVELKGKIYDDPEQGYVTAEEYLSGNVRNKLNTALVSARLDEKYQENVEALKKVMPVDIPMSDIRVRLGASWIPADVVETFVNEQFDYGLNGFALDHIMETGQWVPHFRGGTKAQADRNEANAKSRSMAYSEYGTIHVNLFNNTPNPGVEINEEGRRLPTAIPSRRGILDFALNGGFPKVKRRDDQGEFTDIKATDAANEKLDKLHREFVNWVYEKKLIQERLQKIYNERFNSYVDRQYDGEHLSLPGKVPDEIIKLRPHQKNAIWRFLQHGIAYFAHEVGTGKTFTMIGSIMEARRMGYAKKPIMVVKKSTMEQIAASFLELYPGANILIMRVPENKEKRKAVLARIATGNYDCVIINHDSFRKIPLSPESQSEIISKELQKYERALWQAQANKASHASLKDITVKIRELKAKMQRLAAQERDDIPTMEEMGIDMVVVDEAHAHKNVGFPTRYANMKGVEAKTAKIAFDLFMKTQYLHGRYGRNIIMASGTPLTNSVGELFNIQRYLQPQALDDLGISMFDAWANTFGVMRQEPEYAPEGGRFKLTTRFAEFMNIPELMSLVRQHMDIRSAKDLEIERPDVLGDKPQAVKADQSEYVKAFYEVLRERLRGIRAFGRRAEYLGRNDNMLRIVSDGRLVAMDPRLYDLNAPDDPNSKTNQAVNKVLDLYKQEFDAVNLDKNSPDFGKPYKEKKHLQLIFCDRGVPQGKKKAQASDSSTKFNLYEDIKKKLVAGGMKESEIAFIHDATNPDEQVELFRKARAGEIRVFIGSTGKMGIGVNVQDRVSAIHHLDVDWTYANYEQRNGRGWRYGNQIQEIQIYNYGTAKTVDAFMWSLVAYKEKILQQVMSNDLKVRNLVDISKTSIDAAEMEGILADDPLHKEKIELEEEVRKLGNIQAEYEVSRRRAVEKYARIPGQIEAARKSIENNFLHRQIAESFDGFELGYLKGNMPRDWEPGKYFDLEKDGGKLNDIILEVIKSYEKQLRAGNAQPLFLGRFGKISEEEVEETNKKGEVKKKKVKQFHPMAGYLKGDIDLSFTAAENLPARIIFHIGKDVKNSRYLEGGVKRGLNSVIAGLDANVKEQMKFERLLVGEEPKLLSLINTAWDRQEEFDEKSRRLREVTDILLSRQEEEDMRARQAQGLTEEDVRMEDAEDADFDSEESPIQPDEDMEADDEETKYKLGAQAPEFKPKAKVTASMIREAFPRAGIFQVKDGWRVRLSSGQVIDILPDQEIIVLKAAARRGYGRAAEDLTVAEGEWNRLGRDGLIRLAKFADAKTLRHEVFHAAMSMCLTNTERHQIMMEFGDEETAAEAYANWEPSERRHGLFGKILDFAQKLAEIVLMMHPRPTRTFEKIRSGEVWEREERKLSEKAMRQSLEMNLDPMYKLKPNMEGLDAEQQAAVKHVFADQTQTLKQRMDAALDRWKIRMEQGVFDRFASLKELAKVAGKTAWEENPWVAAQMTTSPGAIFDAVLKHGIPKWKQGATIVETKDQGINAIFAPLGNKLDHFLYWKAATRAQRLAAQDRENLFEPEHIRALLRLREGNEKLFDEVDRKYVAFKKGILDFAEASGVIDPVMREAWEHDEYIPFYRVFDDKSKGPFNKKGIASQSSGIRKLKGGTAQLGDLYVNILMNFTHLIDASIKNHATDLALKAASEIGAARKAPYGFRKVLASGSDIKKLVKEEYGDILEDWGLDPTVLSDKQLENFYQLWSLQKPQGADVVHVLRDGKPEYYQVSDPLLLRSMTAVSEKSWGGPLMTFMRSMRRILTTGVTADPGFMLANIMRDTVSAWVIEPHFKVAVDSVKGAIKTFREDADSIAVASAGAAFHAGYGYDLDEARREANRIADAHHIDKRTLLDTPRRIWEFWKRFGSAFENATRIQIYSNVMASGGTHLEGAFKSKDIMDYSRRGDWAIIRFLCETVPFFGARLQGLQRLGRGALENPKGFLLKGAALAAATLGLLAINWDDDKYKELEEWDKDNYFHFFIGDEHFRLPKPFEVGALFATIPERLFEAFAGDRGSKLLVDRLLFAINQTMSFQPPQLVGPIIEQYANRSFFTGRPIVGMGLERLRPEAQKDPWTSATAAEMGELTGFSPKRIESLIRGYTGTLGMYLLGANDVLVRHMWDYPESPSNGFDDMPVIKRFYHGGVQKNTRYVTDVYDMIKEADGLVATINHYRKTGEVEKAQTLRDENREKLMKRGLLSGTEERLRVINKQIKEIHLSRSMDAETKTQRIEALVARRNKIAEQTYGRAKDAFL